MPGVGKKDRTWIVKIIIPAIVFILGWVLKDLWYHHLVDFIIEQKWNLLLLYVAIMLYISWTYYNWFQFHHDNLRRTWYFLFIIGIIILVGETGFEESQWKRFGLLVSMFVFVDLAIFLTPIISKVAGFEFTQKGVQNMERTNEKMKLQFKKLKVRVKLLLILLVKLNLDLLVQLFGHLHWIIETV